MCLYDTLYNIPIYWELISTHTSDQGDVSNTKVKRYCYRILQSFRKQSSTSIRSNILLKTDYYKHLKIVC